MTFEHSILELRPAMQWWQNYLMESSSEQAENIRNGPLQEVHALQRQLELNLLGSPLSTSAQLEPWLNKFQILYRKLEDIGHQLSPPQVTDLALAIQQRLPLWQAQYPNLPIYFDCQAAVKYSSLNQLVLLALDALIQIIASYSHELLTLQLQQPSEAVGKLSVAIQFDIYYLDLPVFSRQELTYLKNSFAYLSGGDFQEETMSLHNERSLNYFFYWPINSDSPLHSGSGGV